MNDVNAHNVFRRNSVPAPPRPSLGQYLLTRTLPIFLTLVLSLIFAGGLPPTSWRLLFQTLAHLREIYRLHGPAMWVGLALLIMQSLLLLAAWVVLAWLLLKERVVVYTMRSALRQGRTPSLNMTIVTMDPIERLLPSFSFPLLNARKAAPAPPMPPYVPTGNLVSAPPLATNAAALPRPREQARNVPPPPVMQPNMVPGNIPPPPPPAMPPNMGPRNVPPPPVTQPNTANKKKRPVPEEPPTTQIVSQPLSEDMPTSQTAPTVKAPPPPVAQDSPQPAQKVEPPQPAGGERSTMKEQLSSKMKKIRTMRLGSTSQPAPAPQSTEEETSYMLGNPFDVPESAQETKLPDSVLDVTPDLPTQLNASQDDPYLYGDPFEGSLPDILQIDEDLKPPEQRRNKGKIPPPVKKTTRLDEEDTLQPEERSAPAKKTTRLDDEELLRLEKEVLQPEEKNQPVKKTTRLDEEKKQPIKKAAPLNEEQMVEVEEKKQPSGELMQSDDEDIYRLEEKQIQPEQRKTAQPKEKKPDRLENEVLSPFEEDVEEEGFEGDKFLL